MTLNELLTRLIDTRVYASLWVWVGLAALWVMQGNRVLGVPLAVVQAARAGRVPGQLSAWLALTLPELARPERPWAWGLAGFVLSGAAVLGFGYGIDLAQVVALNGAPLLLIGWMGRGLARRLAGTPHDETAVARQMMRHRLLGQLIGMAALTATGLWGLGVLIARAFG